MCFNEAQTMGRVSKPDIDRVIDHLKTNVKGYKPNLTIFKIALIIFEIVLAFIGLWGGYFWINSIKGSESNGDDSSG